MLENCDKLMDFRFNVDACLITLSNVPTLRVRAFDASKSERACIIFSMQIIWLWNERKSSFNGVLKSPLRNSITWYDLAYKV